MTERIKAAAFTHGPAPQRRRQDREGPIHIACLNYLRLALPGAEIHHSANELDLGGDRRSKAIAQAKAKAKGMAPGWPDLEVVWRGHFWFFEVKAPGQKPSADQIARGQGIVRNGGRWAVVSSIDEMKSCIAAWRGDDRDVALVPVCGVVR